MRVLKHFRPSHIVSSDTEHLAIPYVLIPRNVKDLHGAALAIILRLSGYIAVTIQD